MKAIGILLILILTAYTQDSHEESLANGNWTYNYGEIRDVPRFFLCGAEMTQQRSMRTNPEICSQTCRKAWWAFWKSCEWKTECKKAEDSLIWIRSDALRFTFCNYNKWSEQYVAANVGVWPKMGMKMCPANQFVYGFQTKINGRDGLAGLILLCRNPYNTSQSSQVPVLVGEGQWSAPKTSTGYASAFDLKMDSYLTGLRIHFRPLPVIYNMAFNYATPFQITTTLENIQSIVVVNRGNAPIKKMVEFTKVKEYQRVWMNDKSILHNQNLTKIFAESYALSANRNALGLSTKIRNGAVEANIVAQYTKFDNFEFGKSEKMSLGRTQKDEIQVKPCTKKILSQNVYTTLTDIPYIVAISYTNGDKSQTDAYKGTFKGIITSNVEMTIDQEAVC